MSGVTAVFNKLKFFRSLCNVYAKNNYISENTSSIFNTHNLIKYECSFVRHLYCAVPRNAAGFKHRDRKDLLRSVAKIDEGVGEENAVSLDASITSKEDMFVDEKTPYLLFGGIPFNQLPICNIKVTKNNTIINLTDFENKVIAFRSAGSEGFKKCRKGTNVAGQATALAVSSKAVKLGIKDVRLKVQGLGPGRMAAIKGLQMGGLNIISVTDDTRISFKPSARPRKAKRL